MMREVKVNYSETTFEHVMLFGVPCEFHDMRVDRDSIPSGKYVYELGGNNEEDGDEDYPVLLADEVDEDFFGTIISDEELETGELQDGDFEWN